ncbi:MAG: hypothetical protein AAB467_05065 [Patescibacteria group bacterium]
MPFYFFTCLRSSELRRAYVGVVGLGFTSRRPGLLGLATASPSARADMAPAFKYQREQSSLLALPLLKNKNGFLPSLFFRRGSGT